MSLVIVAGGWQLIGGGEAVDSSEIDPTGLLSLPFTNLQTLLANVGAFQEFVGAASASAALASIHLVAETPPERPFAMITYPPSAGWEGLGWRFQNSGRLELSFEDTVTPGLNSRDAEVTFLNDIGEIVSGMQALYDVAGFLVLSGLDIIDGPVRAGKAREAADTDYYRIVLGVSWGP